jgi:hypothetical protein
VTTPPSRPTLPWNGEGEALRGVPLLCSEDGEEEPQVGLIATEDGSQTESDAMILALAPDEALVVDVTRRLDGGAVIEPAHGILVQTVRYYREERDVFCWWACYSFFDCWWR